MDNSQKTPEMTSDKALAATIAGLVSWFVLAFLGLTPAPEDLVSENLQKLIESLAGLVIMAAIPGAAAYFKRNKLK